MNIDHVSASNVLHQLLQLRSLVGILSRSMILKYTIEFQISKLSIGILNQRAHSFISNFLSNVHSLSFSVDINRLCTKRLLDYFKQMSKNRTLNSKWTLCRNSDMNIKTIVYLNTWPYKVPISWCNMCNVVIIVWNQYLKLVR